MAKAAYCIFVTERLRPTPFLRSQSNCSVLQLGGFYFENLTYFRDQIFAQPGLHFLYDKLRHFFGQSTAEDEHIWIEKIDDI